VGYYIGKHLVAGKRFWIYLTMSDTNLPTTSDIVERRVLQTTYIFKAYPKSDIAVI